MTTKKTMAILKKYQKTSLKKRQGYLKHFTEKMIYRTTKTENPETTKGMVRKVLTQSR